MTSTTFKPADYQLVKYTYFDNTLRKVGIVKHPSPDGGIESTIKDVRRFYHAFFTQIKYCKTQTPLIAKYSTWIVNITELMVVEFELAPQ
jgi:hypothetical protein